MDQDGDEKLEMLNLGKNATVKYKGMCQGNTLCVSYVIEFFIIGAIVSVDEFDSHVKMMHNDRDKLFEDEYSVSISLLFLKQCLTF